MTLKGSNIYKNMSSFLAQVATDIIQRFGHDLKDIAIVFNNKRPVVYLKKHLADQIQKTFWSPSFFTIQEFLRTANTRKDINATAQFFLLHEVYNELMEERGQPPQAIDSFYPVAEIILSDFAQIDYELVDAHDIFADLHNISLLNQQFDYLTDEQKQFLKNFWASFSEHQYTEMQHRFLYLWKLLPELYKRFKKALKDQSRHTIAGIYRDLAEGQPDSINIAHQYEKILFIGFNALNKCEVSIFQKWQSEGKALFYFDVDEHYYSDPMNEAGLFIRKNIGSYNLQNALGNFPERLKSRQLSIRTIAAPGHMAQAKITGQLLAKGEANGKTTAIVLADESLLLPVLQSIPSEQDVNITMGFPITQSQVFGLLDLYLENQLEQTTNGQDDNEKIPKKAGSQTVPYPAFVRFLTHPLSHTNEISKNQFLDQLAETGNPDIPVEDTYVKNSVFPDFFQPAANTTALFKGVIGLLSAIFERHDENNMLRHMERQLLQNAIQSLNQLQLGLEKLTELQVPFAIKLIRKTIMKVTATIVGDPLTGIQIMGLLESRNLNFDHIYLLGANEGILPNVSSSPTFIAHSIRRAYDMPVRENQDALSAYLFYRLFHHALQVDILYNGLIDNTNTGEITRFAKQLAYESNLQFIPAAVGWRSENPTKPDRPVTISIPKSGEVWERLQEYLADGNGETRRSLSASAFTTYLNSPLEFFFKYIAGIKEPSAPSEGIEANKLGDVIHAVMQHFYEELSADQSLITRKAIEEKLKTLPEGCKRALHEVYRLPYPSSKPYTSHQRIILRLSEEYCGIFLRHDAREVAPFEIVALENDRDYYYDFPLQISNESRKVRLKGIIDRVDRTAEGVTRIVDYKTGRDDVEFPALFDGQGLPLFRFFESNWEKSNKALIQTLYYTLIYQHVEGAKHVEPNLYAIQKLRSKGSRFQFKVPRKGVHPLAEADLETAKQQFQVFLQEKLEELFNPDVPFEHNPEATIYENSPYYPFFVKEIDFSDPDEELDGT